MKYKPDQIQTHEIKDATLEKGQYSKKVVHVAAGAPAKTNDTGEGYEQGSIWVDSSNGDMYICTDHSAENSTWQNMEGDDVNLFLYQANSKIGRSGGFVDPSPTYQSTHIQMMALASEGDSADIGEVSPSLGIKGWQSGCAKDGTYVYYMGGIGTTPGNSPTDEMVRHGVSSPATLADIGEVTNLHAFGGNATDGSQWITWGGGGGATSHGAPFTAGQAQIEKTTFAASATS